MDRVLAAPLSLSSMPRRTASAKRKSVDRVAVDAVAVGWLANMMYQIVQAVMTVPRLIEMLAIIGFRRVLEASMADPIEPANSRTARVVMKPLVKHGECLMISQVL